MFHDPEILQKTEAGFTPLCEHGASPQDIAGYVKTDDEALEFYRRRYVDSDFSVTGVQLLDIEVIDPNGQYSGSGQKYSLIPAWSPLLHEIE